jgi:uncharacterized protein (DUF2236 family)
MSVTPPRLSFLPLGLVETATARAREVIAGMVRGRVAGDRQGPHVDMSGDLGWFGPDSVAWRVHADLSTLIGGLRALLYQTLHPLAMAGVADHSDYRRDPWGRLHRTSRFVAATTYGTSEAARAAVEQVCQVHSKVRGVAPDGRSYSADTPDLLTWVHATEIDSFLVAYRRYGPAPITDDDADRYVAEMAVVAHAFGADPVPTTRAELAEILASYELDATSQAREAARFLMFPPMPLTMRPVYALIAAAAVELLPFAAQLELGLVVPPLAGPIGVRPATRAFVGTVRWALGESPTLTTARRRSEAKALASE